MNEQQRSDSSYIAPTKPVCWRKGTGYLGRELKTREKMVSCRGWKEAALAYALVLGLWDGCVRQTQDRCSR